MESLKPILNSSSLAVVCRGQLRTLMVTGDHHYTSTSVARKVGMIPADGKVMIIQAESEFQSLHVESDESPSQHEVTPVPQSPSGGQLERGAGGGGASDPLPLLLSGDQPAQHSLGHPLSLPQHGTQRAISHAHGWSTWHQVGNNQGLAQGSASMQGHGLLESRGSSRAGTAQSPEP